MRFTHRDGTTIAVGYCTNVHPAEALDGVVDQLRRYAGSVRERLGVATLGVGLWLSARTVAMLDDRGTAMLRSTLRELGLEVVTLNGFPYGGFHAATVKHTVYQPDWSDRRRLDHTVALAEVLARLLPDDVARGSISTLPLMWRSARDEATWARCLENVAELDARLSMIAGTTGRTIRVAFEPEPGCVVEDVATALAHLPRGQNLGVCLDTCHGAVQFDDPSRAPGALADGGLPIVKLQASCALEADAGAQDALCDFVEPRYLHQVNDGRDRRDDLPEALSEMGRERMWRVHYHVPIHSQPPPPLRATAAHLNTTLQAVFGGPAALTDHVEVETYTWSTLPGPQGDLVDGIVAEMAWIRDRLLALDTVTESTPVTGGRCRDRW